MSPTGGVPGRASGEIYVSLREYERRMRNGYAFPDNVGFIVNLPNRRSFSPDAAFYIGELKGGQFLDGAPVFAAEVRNEGDYGIKTEREMAAKRADYFALPLHGLIVRQPATHRYALTDQGRRIALFFTRSYACLLRPGLAEVESPELPQDTALRRAFAQLERTMDQHAAQRS
jgi:Uma2 family endonuclease